VYTIQWAVHIPNIFLNADYASIYSTYIGNTLDNPNWGCNRRNVFKTAADPTTGMIREKTVDWSQSLIL
jgi:hypothetical protein